MPRRTIEIVCLAVVLLVAVLAFHTWLSGHDEQIRMQSTLATQKQLIDAADARERARDAALKTNLAQTEKLKRDTQTPAQIVSDLQKYLTLPQPIALVQEQGTDAAGGPQARLTVPGKALGHFASPFRKSPGSPVPARSKSARPSATKGFESPSSAPDALSVPPACPDAPGVSSAAPSATPEPLNSSPLPPTSHFDPQSPPLPNAPPQSILSGNGACTNSSGCTAEIPAADLKPLYNYAQDCRACAAELGVARQNASDDASKIAALTRERDAAVTAAKGGTFWRRLRRNLLLFSAGAALGYLAASR